ncbi:MAG: Holliday junction resolvase RuvX [Gammaproteobacteria bacterium]|nr:Holliday junction resolvase RuvX [Gammaproteobacteria bacterium]
MTTMLAFDFGTKSIGVAIGQTITATASPLAAIKAQDGIPNWDLIEQLIKEWQPSQIIVGLPTNMDGTEQPMTLRARKFSQRIYARFKIPVVTHDERLTTAAAKERLFELGGYKKLTKGKIDSVSAVLILESWFETQF